MNICGKYEFVPFPMSMYGFLKPFVIKLVKTGDVGDFPIKFVIKGAWEKNSHFSRDKEHVSEKVVTFPGTMCFWIKCWANYSYIVVL